MSSSDAAAALSKAVAQQEHHTTAATTLKKIKQRDDTNAAIKQHWEEAVALMSDINKWHVFGPEERAENQKQRDAALVLWRSHPRWSASLAQQCINDHDRFRATFGAIASDCMRSGKLDKKMFTLSLKELEEHHQIEDDVFFPRLVRRDSRLRDPVAWLAKDHSGLRLLMKKTLEATDEAVAADAAIVFVTLLIDHICREEQLVVWMMFNGPVSFM